MTDVRRALAELDRAGIRWCVWKGSDHLEASFAGARDLDVLVDRDASEVLAAAGLRHGGGIDWFGLEPATGALVHVQVEDRVVLDDGVGGRWSPPWAADLLDRRRRDDGNDDVWIADPAMEHVVLRCQAAVRARNLARLAGRNAGVAERLARLQRAAGVDAVTAVRRRWLGTEVDDDAAIVDALSTCRLPPATVATLRRVAARRLAARTSTRTRRRGRPLPTGGLVVAVVGADGAGKSSVVADLHRDYEAKFDHLPVYFGSGDGTSLPLFRVFKAARTVGASIAPSSKPSAAKAVWAVALAAEKRRKVAAAARARRAGAIVICDRFPQTERPGISDGPRLGGWTSGWRGRVAAWERRQYDRAAGLGPDLVVRLDVSPAVAGDRRRDHDPDDLRHRIDVVRSMRFAAAGRVADIDADRPYADVLRDVRASVFEGV